MITRMIGMTVRELPSPPKCLKKRPPAKTDPQPIFQIFQILGFSRFPDLPGTNLFAFVFFDFEEMHIRVFEFEEVPNYRVDVLMCCCCRPVTLCAKTHTVFSPRQKK